MSIQMDNNRPKCTVVKTCNTNNIVPVQCCCQSTPSLPKSYCDPGLKYTCERVYRSTASTPMRSVPTWSVNTLVSNRINEAPHLDPSLVNPWGIVFHNNQLWVVNGSTDLVTNYDLFGNKMLANITVRDAYHNSSFPTGIAVNCGGNFPVSNGTISRSATLILCSEHGTVNGYNPVVNPQAAYLALNTQLTGEISVFRGLTIANNTLYLANFFQRHIDVFDSSYNRINGYNFVDNDSVDPIPMDYTPNNIVYLGGFIYVLYAKKNPNNTINDLPGPGHGFISMYNPDGSFVRRFASRGVLNSPWAMIQAPCNCGYPPGSFIVGNNGDGRLNAFDCNGKFIGPLLSPDGIPIVIDGLWGLAAHYTDGVNEIYYAAAADQNIDGKVGCLVQKNNIYF